MSDRNGGDPAGTESGFRDHLTALEEAADQLERDDLDPEQALRVFKVALRHHQAADEILNRVQEEFAELCDGE